jgi:hypothetical protein
MTALTPITLNEAQAAVAVANTPLFLVRRLRENPALRRAHVMHGAEKIFAALQTVLPNKPSDLTAATEAYFYLVALSLDDDKSWLRRALALSAPHIKWFSDIAEYLVETAKPTVAKTLDLHASPAVSFAKPHKIATSNTSRQIKL